MTKEDFNRQVRRAAFLTFALVACIVFGAVVLIEGDWIPGGIIVASASVGFARQLPVIRKLCNERPATAPRTGKPAS